MVLQGHLSNKKHLSMATKPTWENDDFLDRLLPIMSHDLLTMWPFEIRDSLTGGGSVRKRLSSHRLLVLVLVFFHNALLITFLLFEQLCWVVIRLKKKANLLTQKP